MRTFRPIPDVNTLKDLLGAINERFRTFNSQGGGNAFSGDMGGQRIKNVGAPTENTDAVNAAWVKSRIAGLEGKAGEPGPSGPPGAGRISVKSAPFNAVGDGVAEDRTAIQACIDSVSAAGGGEVYFPVGVFRSSNFLNVPDDVHLVGDGEASVILRGGAVDDNKGLVHITGNRTGVRDLKIEGNVITTATLAYEAFDNDPRNVILTKNTSIWLDRVEYFTISRVTFSHSGGYSAYVDRSKHGSFVDNECRNCRPHTFGTTAGPTAGLLHFGSYNGGFFVVGDGTDMCDDIYFAGNGCSRHTGTHIWSWAPSVGGNLHTGIECIGNYGEDIGRDGILLGAALGPVAKGNFYHRIGYITNSDSGGAGVPRWLRGHWSVGIDTSGLTRGAVYQGNVLLSCLGGAMDLDGFAFSSCKGNLVDVPKPGTPQYTEDRISEWLRALEVGEPGYPGTAVVQSYGINLGDTQNNVGGSVANIDGNVISNCGGGAIRMYGAINCSVTGNLIDHPSDAQFPPVALGRGGAGGNQGCKGNLVTGNHIAYEPAAAVPAIFEDATLGALDGPNRVFGNFINSTTSFEFQPHSSSGSSTAISMTTASAGVSVREEMRFQVEGTGSAKSLKLYAVAAAAVAQVMSVSKAGFANFSDNGGAGTGVLATGARTTAAWGDTVVTGKGYFDAFAAIRQYTSGGTFSSSEANALDNTHALLRYNPAIPDVEKSVTTLAGARVWVPVGLSAGSGPSVPGASSEVLFNDGGAFGADAGFVYDKSANRITLAGTGGAVGFILQNGWMESAGGYVTPSTAANAIQAAGGGVTALSHIATRNDGASGFTLVRSSSTARTWGLGIDATGQLFVRDETAGGNRLTFDAATGRATFSAQVVVGGAASGSGLLVQDGYIESAEGFYSNVGSYQAFQAGASGGMYARSLRATTYVQIGQSFGVPSLTPGDSFAAGAKYWDTSIGAERTFNGSSWVTDGAGAVTGVTSLNANLTASPTTGAVNLNFSATPTFASMALTGFGNALTLSSGYVQAAGGFNYTGFAQNGIQAQTGGVAAQNFNVANGFGGWSPAIDSARNVYAASLKATNGLDLIDASGVFRGNGLDTIFFANVGGVNIKDPFSGTKFGRTATFFLTDSFGGSQVLIFRNGILTTT